MRTHETEFPHIQIPEEIKQLVREGRMRDTSWHNDACPSFEFTKGGETFILWIEEERPNSPHHQRFALTDDDLDAEDFLLETPSILDILEFING